MSIYIYIDKNEKLFDTILNTEIICFQKLYTTYFTNGVRDSPGVPVDSRNIVPVDDMTGLILAFC